MQQPSANSTQSRRTCSANCVCREHFETALAPAKPHQASDPAAAALRAVVKVRRVYMGTSCS